MQALNKKANDRKSAEFTAESLKNNRTDKLIRASGAKRRKRLHMQTLPLSFVAGGFVGALVFVILYGFKIIDPTYVDWLYAGRAGGDGCLYQFSWEFFRNDSWRFPIGMMENFPTSTGGVGILWTDTIPLFAIFFKCFRDFLPDAFQYYGIWHLFSFFLEGGFACCILKKWISKLSVCLSLTPLFVLTSFNLFRTFHHMALGGLWVVLFPIFIWVYKNEIFYNTRRQCIAWAIATALTIWVQTYFLLPVGIAMVSFLMGEWIDKRNKGIFLTFSLCVAAVLVSFWLLGGFTNSGGVRVGKFGDYSMNVLALVDSDGLSRIFPDIPSGDLNYEGWQYLGAAGILLLLLSLVYTVYHLALTDDWLHNIKRHKGKIISLSFCFLATTVVSLSSVVWFGSKVIINYSWCKPIMELMSAFRCSGRSFWLCTYMILFFAVITVFKRFKRSSPAIVCALCLIVLQVYDLSPLIQSRTWITRDSVEYVSPLASAFWEDVAPKINHINRLSYHHWGYGGEYPLDFYATAHHLTLNNGYIGRNDDVANMENVRQCIESVAYEAIESDTLYCVEEDFAFTDMCLTGGDVVELRCDGYRIFIHKALWDQLDQSKYQDIYQENTGEYMTFRLEYATQTQDTK